MAWRFRKSFKLLPGVRVNVSKSGISTSIGAAPFTLNIGRRGVHATASLPGTGISIRHRIGAPAHRATAAPHALPASRQAAPPSPPTPAAANLDPGEPIRSAGADAMTSPGLPGLEPGPLRGLRERLGGLQELVCRIGGVGQSRCAVELTPHSRTSGPASPGPPARGRRGRDSPPRFRSRRAATCDSAPEAAAPPADGLKDQTWA